jgi:uncharacterized protein
VTVDWHEVLKVVVGSQAYGLANAGSDTDYLSLAAAPTTLFHGLHPPVGKASTRVAKDPDHVTHEIGKAATLMLGCNPTLLEVLWLPVECRVVFTDLAAELICDRDAFLSRQAVRNAFLGYATQQFKRLQVSADGGGTYTFGSDVRHRPEKHARHLMRLCHQGLQLYATGTMDVRVTYPETYHAFGEAVVRDPDVARQLIESTEERFNHRVSPLPERPDEGRVETWLRWVRREIWWKYEGS